MTQYEQRKSDQKHQTQENNQGQPDGPRLDIYAVYSTDDESQSVHSERSESLTLQDSGFVDLTYVKETPTITDNWGSYWSRRERCCCFCNCVISITLVVLVTIVVMASKGLLELKQQPTSGTVAENRQYTYKEEANAVTRQLCTTPRAPEQPVSTCILCSLVILITYLS
ncbi:hypothetical protein DPMN_036067 [Dreissena polymorpha]|uniref:Uncharacterized protein n=1 Tax=Dreissena polymorpha TaxID=45954 RepID=A0A9D4MBW3_DREPO|nr:hypothetical protein DPMN_036066 [Dreissena polymorpha]KAH3872844.1 hypothetical protein DPMN_036067 [Dreissena polymorpha]